MPVPHHPPKAVVFDLGKVLLDFDFRIAAGALARSSPLAVHEFQKVLDQSPLLHRYESGRMTAREFHEAVAAATGYRGNEREFRDGFGDIFAEIRPMIELQERLRARRVPTFIFSNTNDIAVETIRARFPFFHRFDGYVYSYEVGAMKPEAVIYEKVESMTGLSGADLLYLDDRLENIEAGRARGWQSLLHHDPAVTVPEVHTRLGW